MILNTFGCPPLGWGQVSEICSCFGVEHGRVVSATLSLVPASDFPRLLGNVRVVYLDSMDVLRRWAPRFQDGPEGNVLILGLPSAELRTLKIPERQRFDLLDLAVSLSDNTREFVTLSAFCHIKAHLDTFAGESLIGSLHAAFYRIEDKVLRAKQSQAVYEFLAGARVRAPKTGIKKIDVVLADPRTKEFIKVCKAVASNPSLSDTLPASQGFDSFEILFTLKKSGSL